MRPIPYREHLADLERTFFTAKRRGFLRLDMNESVGGLSPELVTRALARIDPESLASYPEYGELEALIAERDGIFSHNVLISPGSDSAIKYVFDAFVSPGDRVLLTEPSFAMYRIYCRTHQAEAVAVEYGADLSLPVREFLAQLSRGVRLAIVTNPNNPTGSALEDRDLEAILGAAEDAGVLLAVDEAYFHFHSRTIVPRVADHGNLVVLRTFSKLCGMAGARLGYAAAHPEVLSGLRKVKPSFDVGAPAVAIARTLLEEPGALAALVREFQEGKRFLVERLREAGVPHVEGRANFVLVRCGARSPEIVKSLAERRILVRGGFDLPILADYVRVTVGRRSAMEVFWEAFREVWPGEGR